MPTTARKSSRSPTVRPRKDAATPAAGARHGVARVLSKLGFCSRTQAAAYVREGRVAINGRIVRDPEAPVAATRDRISLDGTDVHAAERIYLMLNKPRGYVTTARDERGRDTVYTLLAGAGLPWIAPAGRLDKASEGLLLLSNDSEWAARITAPESRLDKTYHVQIGRVPDERLLRALRVGIEDRGEHLSCKSVSTLRQGDKTAWLEIVLDEGRNRQIRRLLAALDVQVLRLVRVAVGPLELGNLRKGESRALTAAERKALAV
jgi:23S rRNA pseudouridine2605 synthase